MIADQLAALAVGTAVLFLIFLALFVLVILTWVTNGIAIFFLCFGFLAWTFGRIILDNK